MVMDKYRLSKCVVCLVRQHIIANYRNDDGKTINSLLSIAMSENTFPIYKKCAGKYDSKIGYETDIKAKENIRRSKYK